MRAKTMIPVAAICGIMACSDAPTLPAGPKQLATDADIALLQGRTITFQEGQSFKISGGTIQGTWDGKPLRGAYVMRDGFFCRTLSAGPRGPAPEDCQLLILENNVLSVTRDKGQGASFQYTIS